MKKKAKNGLSLTARESSVPGTKKNNKSRREFLRAAAGTGAFLAASPLRSRHLAHS